MMEDKIIIGLGIALMIVFGVFYVWMFANIFSVMRKVFGTVKKSTVLVQDENEETGKIVLENRKATPFLSVLCYIAAVFSFAKTEIPSCMMFGVVGMLYNAMRDKAPETVWRMLRFLGLCMVMCFAFERVLPFLELDTETASLVGQALCFAPIFFLIPFLILSFKNAKYCMGPYLVKGSNYPHPCSGQCEDPDVILEKTPTPRYQHACRAPCATATRSGRYYKGKQRKYTW